MTTWFLVLLAQKHTHKKIELNFMPQNERIQPGIDDMDNICHFVPI